MTPRGIVWQLVLDTEAASALLSSMPVNPTRAEVVTAIAAANGRRVVDAAVTLAAERVRMPGDVVDVLTSDVEGLRALSAHIHATVDVVGL